SFSSLPVLLRPPRPTLCPYTTLFRSTARTRAAWIVQPVFSGLSVRDCANARDRRTNRPAPRATRIATVWRYGEARNPWAAGEPRSEEHTSELQSREKLVCRLLLEKKK